MKLKIWLFPIANALVSFASLAFVCFTLPYIMTYGTWNMGGLLYVMIGCIAWIFLYLPATQFLYLAKIVKGINKKFRFTLYNTLMGCLPVIALSVHYLIIGAYQGLWLLIIVVWCEVCGLIVLKRRPE